MNLPALRSLRVHFDRPCGLDEEIALRWQIAQDRTIVAASNSLGRLMRMTLQVGAPSDRIWAGPRDLPPPCCQEKSLEDLAAEAGELELVLPVSFATLFPNLHGGFSSSQAAAPLAKARDWLALDFAPAGIRFFLASR